MADKVKIEIGGDTSGAEASIKDLENSTKKSFTKMSAEADKSSAEVSKAFKNAGIRTEKAINESSRKAKRDFEKIKNSGVASANEIKRAHTVMTAKIKKNQREMSTGAGILSKVFKAFSGNLLAIGASAVALGFSLKKLFDFGESAAKLKAQTLAFKNFTANLGEDSDDLLKKLKEVSRGTVSQADLIKSAGTALLLGLDPTKITELLEVARASSKITGESLTTQFEDVAKGTGRASKLILDNLGIMFSQEEATRRAAAAAGVLASELTAQQISVGNLTEVIRQGQPIIQGVGKDFDSQADVLARITARYTNLVNVIGQKFLKILPKIEIAVLKISKRFLLNIKTISKLTRSFSVLTDFLKITTGATDRADHGIDNLGKGMESLEKRIQSANKVQAEMNANNGEGAERLQGLIDRARERKKLLGEQEQEITKNMNTEIAAINATSEAQKVKNELIKKQITATKAELRELQSEVKRSADFAQQILDTIANSQKKRAQSGFDPLEKLVDDLARAEDDFEQASKERAAGNVDRARELTLSAVKAANAILEVQKDGSADSEVTTGELIKANVEAERLVASAEKFAAAMQRSAEDAIPLAEERLATLESQLALGKATVAGVTDAIAVATDMATLLKIKLSENTTATHTQTINTVNTGNSGASIPGFSTGAKLHGYGGGDKILARLEKGERIIKKEATRNLERLGPSAMNALHKGDIDGLISSLPLPGFNQGGKAGDSDGATTNVNLNLGSKTFPMKAKSNVVDEFAQEIKNINVVRGRKSIPF